MVQAKKVQYGKIFLLAWRVVLGNVRFREGVNISSLPTVQTTNPRHAGRVTCRWASELDELIPFRLIGNSAMIILVLLEIFRRRWGAKEGGADLRQ